MTANLQFECQNYREVTDIHDLFDLLKTEQDMTDCLVQLKYDGIWARVEVQQGHASIYSKTDTYKNTIQINQIDFLQQPCTLVGEYMMGSQWSQHPDRAGQLFIFDCTYANGKDLTFLPYKDRYRVARAIVENELRSTRIVMAPCYSASKLGPLWSSICESNSHEGIVFRKWSSTWFTELVKLKQRVQDDFVVMGFTEGEGQFYGYLGSLTLGQYDSDGVLREVMSVGGGFTTPERQLIFNKQTDYQGRVCLVEGKSRFTSGALRHPTFIRWRDDKDPKQCTLKRTSP